MFPVVRLAGSYPLASCSGRLDSTFDYGMVAALDIVVAPDMLAVHGMAADLDGIADPDMAVGLHTVDVPGMAADDLHTIADLDGVEFWPDMKSCAAKGCRWAIPAVL